MKLGLRGKFLWTTIGLILLGTLLSAGISFFLAQSMLRDMIKNQLEQQSESILEYVASFIENRKQDITLWSQQPIIIETVVMTYDADTGSLVFIREANETLKSYQKAHVYFEEIGIATAGGDVLTTSLTEGSAGLNTGRTIKDEIYFQKAVSGSVFISEITQGHADDCPELTIAAPIKNNDNIQGVLFGTVNLNYITERFVATKKIGAGGYVFLFDKDGRVIAHPDKAKVLKASIKNTEYGRSMLDQKQGILEYDEDGARRIAAFQQDKDIGWSIAAVANVNEQMAPVMRLLQVNFGSAFAVLLIAVGVILFLATWVSRPIKNISVSLDEVAGQVSNAATQISQSSQMLAQGASEQASSIEETSASLEELASMANHNADNAQQASILSNEARQAAANGAAAMDGLMTAMDGINQSSQEVAKVAKGIEEIAFQTNLLALNAAVEAARAGEAGRGFAVVAEEVRNLAQRASEHAKTTSSLITESRTRSKEGSRQAGEVNNELQQIFQGVEKVVGLVTEISAASKEQAQGIEQINKAVNSMDQVVQQNSASSEQSASASQQLSGQAFHMKALVRDLSEKVAGAEEGVAVTKHQGKNIAESYPEEDWEPRSQQALDSSRKHPHTQPPTSALPPSGDRLQGAQVRPEDIIPFDDDDLKDF